MKGASTEVARRVREIAEKAKIEIEGNEEDRLMVPSRIAAFEATSAGKIPRKTNEGPIQTQNLLESSQPSVDVGWLMLALRSVERARFTVWREYSTSPSFRTGLEAKNVTGSRETRHLVPVVEAMIVAEEGRIVGIEFTAKGIYNLSARQE